MRDRKTDDSPALSRRDLMKGLGGLGVASLAGLSGCLNIGQNRQRNNRLQRAYNLRITAAQQLLEAETAEKGVIGRYDAKHGTYTKGLPHNEFGEVNLAAYQQLDKALEGMDIDEYNAIPLGKGRPLANPIAARAFNLIGADGHQEPMPEAPAVGSDVAASEMVELYWRALLRDVPFEEYDTNPLAQAALDELSSLSGYQGPTSGSPKQTLFRSNYEGAESGPFISQFLLQDAPYGAMQVQQTLEPQVEEDFMTDFDDWLAVLRGEDSVVGTETYENERTRIKNGRDLLTYVHRNIPAQSAVSAAYYLLGNGYRRAAGLRDMPLQKQNAFVEFGPPMVSSLVNSVSQNVKQATWYHKWLAHRRARPEKYGGLVHVHESDMDRTYDFLNDDLLDSKAVRRTNEKYGSRLLPQGYPEGSPTHPSYPAGHSVFIGASVTVLKALFDGDATLDRTVRVGADGTVEETDEELTVRGELHKLASNHAFGRDFSGIHYRTDGREGHKLGERAALECLQDELRATAVKTELTLKGFNGDDVTVTPNGIQRR